MRRRRSQERRSRSPVAAVVLAIAGSACLAAPATAAISASQITAPTGPHYSIRDFDAPAGVAVSGTTTGAVMGDEVDLLCYHDDNTVADPVAIDVPVNSNAFSVSSVDTAGIIDRLCTLSAVPENTTPMPPASFMGPVMATGSRFANEISSGPNAGTITDFELWAQQLVGGVLYQSAGACGISEASLFDSTQTDTTDTWQCNAFFDRDNDPIGPGTRSGIRVDGSNAYTPVVAAIINDAAAGLPPLSFSHNLDPATGNVTIDESEEIVACPDPAFPASGASCPSFLDTGVRLEREILQENDGRVIRITDEWSSIDDQAHSLDLLNQNDQEFGENSEVAYKFPGEPGFDTHSPPDTVIFPDTTPAAIYLQRGTSPPDPDENGKGAIIFDTPGSPATFNFGGGQFNLHHTAAIPADGCVTIRFTYVHAYASADVQSLADDALADLSSPSACADEPTPPTSARCGGELATKVGTAGADVLRGTSRADVIAGLGGGDRIRGLAGGDRLCGGAGRDRLIGGPGRDRLIGGPGRDRLIGGPGRDRLKGGPGRDRCKGGQGRDVLRGC